MRLSAQQCDRLENYIESALSNQQYNKLTAICYIRGMCGIAGIVGLVNSAEAGRLARRMTGRLAHRGPDADGFFTDAGIALGHRRLAIIDLSENANQPQTDGSGRFVIILNGEIYNFRDVKRSIPDYQFLTNSDTEAVVAAYAAYGPDCLSLLNGMFALAIWDKVERSLFIARDRLGVKPLYYAVTNNGAFLFASEIRSILESGLVEKKISRDGLYDYLMYQSVYAPRTIVDGITQLGAGEYAIVKDGEISRHSYWQLENAKADAEFDDEAEVKDRVRTLLLESAERRLVSDVRVGAFLSGGIDSSAVVGLMSEVSDQPVDTFSVVFDDGRFDESKYSDLISKRFDTRHTRIQLTPNDLLSSLPEAIRSIDSPSGDGINTYVVSKAVRNAGIKVALSGLGGDELFAGYPNFLRWFKAKNGLLSKLPRSVRSAGGKILAQSSNSRYRRAADLLDQPAIELANIYPLFRQVMSQQDANEYCPTAVDLPTTIKAILEKKADKIEDFPLLSQFTIAELLGYTQSVLLKDTDQFSMASALEVREPFFDYKLVEYVLRIPDKIKYPRYPKSLLVDALAPMLPDEIVHRTKMGFAFPWAEWMRNELSAFCAERIRSLEQRDLLDPLVLNRRWSDFLSGRNGVAWSQIWHLVVLSDWLDSNGF